MSDQADIEVELERREAGEPGCYRAYGLVFDSDIPLLLLPTFEEGMSPEADVVVRRGSLPRVGPPPERRQLKCWSDGTDAGFNVPTLGEFRVTGGREIVYDLDTEEHLARVPAYVIGVAMALVLYQRGFLILHGSAVEHDGRCFAFVAPKYHGKSTVSAALQMRGCRLVTDDMIAVKIDESGVPMVSPGYPFSKVWPDAFAAMGEDAETHPRFLEGYEKRLRLVGPEAMVASPIPLTRVYVLEWGDERLIERLPRAEGFQQAVIHTHHHVFSLLEATPGGTVDHFRALGGTLRHASVCRLVRPRRLEELDVLCTALLADFASCSG